ncbi:xylulose kinase-1 [Tanacetum coccineum]
MSTLTFPDTHNMVAFLEKPAESDGFHEIIDFLNANQIHYALTVNPTIYTPCIEQFWATAKIKTVNGERQIQALVDKKKVIITESSIRSDLHLEDADGTDCLPTATIFEELARIGYEKPSQKLTFYKAFFSPQWKFLIHTITQCLSAKTTAWNEFSSTMASAIICLATNQNFNLSKYIFDVMLGDMSHHKKIYVNPSHTKKIFANMKREGKYFSKRVTPLFATMMVQANQEEGVDSGIPTNSQQTPITIQPSTSKPQKKQSRRKQKKTIAVPHPSDSTADATNKESVPTHSNDPLLSGEDRLKLTDLMDMCTKLYSFPSKVSVCVFQRFIPSSSSKTMSVKRRGTKSRCIVGVVTVIREWYEDEESGGGAVDVKEVGEMRRIVDLKEMKKELLGVKGFKEFGLFKQSRLSVVPVEEGVWVKICEMGNGYEGDGFNDGECDD